jgi:hypothetical protein
MEAALRNDLTAKSILWTWNEADLALHHKVQPPVPAPMPAALAANASDAVAKTYDRAWTRYAAQTSAWNKWLTDEEAIESACSVALACLMSHFDPEGRPHTLRLSTPLRLLPTGAVDPAQHMEQTWIHVWNSLKLTFEPNQAVDALRLREEWLKCSDTGCTLSKFSLDWNLHMTRMTQAGVPPTEAEQLSALTKAIKNPKILDFLMETIMESAEIPVPVVRIHTLASFWKRLNTAASQFIEIDNWGVSMGDTFYGEDKKPYENKRKDNPSKKPKGENAKTGAENANGQQGKTRFPPNPKGKYGPSSGGGDKRARSPIAQADLVCYRCGGKGHRTYDRDTGVYCRATFCKACHKDIGDSEHATNKCTPDWKGFRAEEVSQRRNKKGKS